MSRLQRIDLTRTARLVLDPREWAGTAVRPGVVPRPMGAGGPVVTPVVRVTAPLTITATPAGPGWPFAGPVELVTRQTPAGLLAWYGRVKVPDGGPLRRLPAVRCDLRVTADGFRPADLPGVDVPADGDRPVVRALFLYPTGELPDAAAGPTVLTGRETAPGPDGRPGRVTVRVEYPAGPFTPTAVLSDEDGAWVLEWEPPAGPTVDLTFTFPDGSSRTVTDFPVTPNRLNRFPRTTLSGRAVGPTGRPVAGAAVGVALTPWTVPTRDDGRFVFALPAEKRSGGREWREVTVTRSGGAGVTARRQLTFGQDNPVGEVVV